MPYQIVHAATAVISPANPKNALFDWRARSSGVGILEVDVVNDDGVVDFCRLRRPWES